MLMRPLKEDDTIAIKGPSRFILKHNSICLEEGFRATMVSRAVKTHKIGGVPEHEFDMPFQERRFLNAEALATRLYLREVEKSKNNPPPKKRRLNN